METLEFKCNDLHLEMALGVKKKVSQAILSILKLPSLYLILQILFFLKVFCQLYQTLC